MYKKNQKQKIKKSLTNPEGHHLLDILGAELPRIRPKLANWNMTISDK
jgi:hypothetical protein